MRIWEVQNILLLWENFQEKTIHYVLEKMEKISIFLLKIQKKYIRKSAETKRIKNNQKQNVDETIQTQYNMVIDTHLRKYAEWCRTVLHLLRKELLESRGE